MCCAALASERPIPGVTCAATGTSADSFCGVMVAVGNPAAGTDAGAGKCPWTSCPTGTTWPVAVGTCAMGGATPWPCAGNCCIELIEAGGTGACTAGKTSMGPGSEDGSHRSPTSAKVCRAI